jgi:transglutaminase-like putative cysteine protease
MPSNTSLLWLMLGLTLSALPHFFNQPIWVAILFIGMITWRTMSIVRGWPLPKKSNTKLKWIQRLITLMAMALLLISYGSLVGRDAGVALLTVMLGLKISEIYSQRDYYLSCFLGFFLLVTTFFYSQSMLTALLMMLVVIIMASSLISLNDRHRNLSTKATLKLSGKMVLQSIPLMLVLFVLFPRIPGPLWGLPNDAHNTKTGIDNKMTIGSINQLILSDEVAFRVKFDGMSALPAQSKLYWRGPVLWHSDGKTWTELSAKQQAVAVPLITNQSADFRYTMTLEPHNKHWLFALDFPQQAPANIASSFTYDGQLISKEKIIQRQQYTLTSDTAFSFNADSEALINIALALPKGRHPKAVQLAQQWREQSPDPQQLINMALRYFNQQEFHYSLSPPPLSDDVIDSFLFDTRSGFCEHYAASFTILMRAAGIPARVVTGYQGGEINPVDDFLVIRQRDAHAWTEVWIASQGWVRVDPTAAVASERIDRGMNTIMPLSMRTPTLLPNNQHLAELWQTIRNNWEAIDNRWNQWVLAYGPELQKQFLAKLGMSSPNWQSMAIWLFASISSVLLILTAWVLFRWERKDPVIQIYQRFCNKASKVGVTRSDNEGPIDFSHRLKQKWPEHAEQIDGITELYITLRYGEGDHDALLALFKEQVAELAFRQSS